jgi:predicted component of type VI protein secretion system
VARRNGQRFVLQFSTGESVTVYGSGLIGRNPRPEPGEYFDQIVRVLDTGRSVSKTHLEFGQEGGVFWVKDRFSGNGTVLNEPDAEPRRCDPDKRVRVLRGSRVEIGEQFFVVS